MGKVLVLQCALIDSGKPLRGTEGDQAASVRKGWNEGTVHSQHHHPRVSHCCSISSNLFYAAHNGNPSEQGQYQPEKPCEHGS